MGADSFRGEIIAEFMKIANTQAERERFIKVSWN